MTAVLNLPVYEEHEDFPAFQIGNEILGRGFLSSRLAVRIRQNEGLSYGVGSYVNPLSPDPTSLYSAYAIFAPENRDRVVSAFKEEVDKVLDPGFSEEEVQAAIKGYLDAQQNSRTNDGVIASMLRSNLLWGRTMDFTSNFERAVEDLTAEQVHDAMRDYLEPGQIAIFTAGDFARVSRQDDVTEARESIKVPTD